MVDSGEYNSINELKNEVINFIRALMPLSKNFRFGEDGDMIKGININFILGNKEYSLHQKTCRRVEKGKSYYYISGVTGIHKPDIDYLGFQSSNGVLFIFKNTDKLKIKDYEGYEKIGKKYQIPLKNYVAEKKIKKKTD